MTTDSVPILLAIIFTCGIIIFVLLAQLAGLKQKLSDAKLALQRKEQLYTDLANLAARSSHNYEKKNKELANKNEELTQKCQELEEKNKVLELQNKDQEELIIDFKSGLNITDEFLRVRELVRQKKQLIFVHGGAGTGKSTLLSWLRRQGLIDIVLAPTGLAALNVDGFTIHKFFGFEAVNIIPKNKTQEALSRTARDILPNAKTICIDEISMVKVDMIDAINRALQVAARNDQLFGGYQILFLGDLYQLPPIVESENQKFFGSALDCPKGHGWPSCWFLDADALLNQEIHRVDLTHVFRQDAVGKFAGVLNDLRCYKNIEEHVNYLNNRIHICEKAPGNTVILAAKNAIADAYNDRMIDQLEGEEFTFPATMTGVFLKQKERQKNRRKESTNFPANPLIRLKVGAFVMLLYNDPDKCFVNGSTGRIEEIDTEEGEDRVAVRLKNGNLVRVSRYTWKRHEVVWNKKLGRFENQEIGSFTQIPVTPAYAISCHKAQGKTLDSIYLDIEGVFSPGQMYVALSRVRNLDDIYSKRILSAGDFPSEPYLRKLQCEGRI